MEPSFESKPLDVEAKKVGQKISNIVLSELRNDPHIDASARTLQLIALAVDDREVFDALPDPGNQN